MRGRKSQKILKRKRKITNPQTKLRPPRSSARLKIYNDNKKEKLQITNQTQISDIKCKVENLNKKSTMTMTTAKMFPNDREARW